MVQREEGSSVVLCSLQFAHRLMDQCSRRVMTCDSVSRPGLLSCGRDSVLLDYRERVLGSCTVMVFASMCPRRQSRQRTSDPGVTLLSVSRAAPPLCLSCPSDGAQAPVSPLVPVERTACLVSPAGLCRAVPSS